MMDIYTPNKTHPRAHLYPPQPHTARDHPLMTSPLHPAEARLLALAAAQLDAYNRADLDAFCACYSNDVRVFRDGELISEGAVAFRARYQALFERGEFGARVETRQLEAARVDAGGVSVSCVDFERWWRGAGELRAEGEVWARYHLWCDPLQAATPEVPPCAHALISRVEFSVELSSVTR